MYVYIYILVQTRGEHCIYYTVHTLSRAPLFELSMLMIWEQKRLLRNNCQKTDNSHILRFGANWRRARADAAAAVATFSLPLYNMVLGYGSCLLCTRWMVYNVVFFFFTWGAPRSHSPWTRPYCTYSTLSRSIITKGIRGVDLAGGERVTHNNNLWLRATGSCTAAPPSRWHQHL